MTLSRNLATEFDAATLSVADDFAPNRLPQPDPHLELTMGAVRMHRLDADAVRQQVGAALGDPTGRPLAIGSVNLDHVFHFGVLGADAVTTRAVRWLMLVDGAPVAKRAGVHTGRPWPRLTGADLLPDLLAQAACTGTRVGFLGGTAESSRALVLQLEARWPELVLAGVWTPPRHVIDDARRSAKLADDIAAAGVELLVVGLGKPRQERWIARHGVATGARVLTAFGAAAGFIARTERRAPLWMRRAGIEWSYRLLTDPRRLWRRYLVQGPKALGAIRREPVTLDYVALPGGDPAQ